MTDLVDRLCDAWRNEVDMGKEALLSEAADEIERLRAEVEQQRLELGITEDACGMLESEVKQLRARVAELEALLCIAWEGRHFDGPEPSTQWFYNAMRAYIYKHGGISALADRTADARLALMKESCPEPRT